MSYTDNELADWADIASARVLFGDCMEKMKEIPDCSIDAIVCDPPYGLSPDGIARTWSDIEEGRKIGGFMGKGWDAAVPCHNFFAECYRVLKHGGHLIAFSSTRTVFALGMACQKGGFELRDQIFWCYFSGFPKSHNLGDIGDQWSGFGTALKPAVEPALLARKPLEKGLTIAQNVLKHGTGALNIDGCRFGYGDPCWVGPNKNDNYRPPHENKAIKDMRSDTQFNASKQVFNNWSPQGRWPANLYQCAKASRSEREAGLSHLKAKSGADAVQRKEGSAGINNPRAGAGRTADEVKNFHPTVKPLKLMRWCCRLVGGQKGSVILDPFGGSGTTGAAAILEGFDCVLIEREPEYLPIIEGRLRWARQEYKRENAQLKLFGG